MERPVDRTLEVFRTPDRDLRLIREAIALVASGGSPRVVLAGLAFADGLLDAARSMALEAGVRIQALARADDDGADVAVERITE
ncbi:MAG TPA: hypothetical protein VFM38_00735 [Candidatus Limnocylindrales bacterium]|nr:hypothetical protein [Candidatus Limnocylindrales bacterium]